jgi:asparagine synthase (glutamine-hydrolysing)
MCAIFGIIAPRGTPEIDLSAARRGVDLMRHRGPDDEGFLLADSQARRHWLCAGPDTEPSLNLPDIRGQSAKFDLVLGHRRLSILDLSPAGHQPMASADGRFAIVFNGEIYNYVELREELQKEGFTFRTSTDTEVLLAAYRHWGAEALSRFVGMFAFAIYDVERQEVFLARDFFGIKPLYYSRWNGHFAFSSEIKPLLELPGSRRTAHPDQLYQYLRFGITDGAEETVFDGVREIPAAHYMAVRIDSPGEASPIRFWQIDLSRRIDISEQDAANMVHEVLDDSVRLHLRSDVPLGTCLSGGVDSTAILMLMGKHVPDRKRIQSFTFITDDPVLSEGRFMRVACKAAGIESNQVLPSPQELVGDLEDLVRVQELPFGGTSIYAQYRVFRLARENGMKVMLDGQGSDEMFGGYYSLLGARLTSLLASGRILDSLRLVSGAPGNMRQHFVRMALWSAGRLLPDGATRIFRYLVGEPLWPGWLNRRWFEQRGVVARERLRGRGRNAFSGELLASLVRLSLPQILRYEDRNSMAHSIESRVPFCNSRVAELAYSLPEDLLVSRQGETKAILKKALRGVVPEAILSREKVGFGTPEKSWLGCKELSTMLQTSAVSEVLPLVRPKDHINAALSRRVLPSYTWRLINLIIWSRVFQVNFSN